MLEILSEILKTLQPILMSPVAGALLVTLVSVSGCSFALYLITSRVVVNLERLTDASLTNGNKLDNLNESVRDLTAVISCQFKNSMDSNAESKQSKHYNKSTKNRFSN